MFTFQCQDQTHVSASLTEEPSGESSCVWCAHGFWKSIIVDSVPCLAIYWWHWASHRTAESEFPCLCNTYFTCLLWRSNKNMHMKPLTWYMTGGRHKVTDLLNTSIRVLTLYVQIFLSSPLRLLFLGRFILKKGTGVGLLFSLLLQSHFSLMSCYSVTHVIDSTELLQSLQNNRLFKTQYISLCFLVKKSFYLGF